jgi:hypothetical protein
MTEQTNTAPEKEPSGAVKMLGDFAPALVSFTDDVLFGQVWTRPELSPRDRMRSLTAAGRGRMFSSGAGCGAGQSGPRALGMVGDAVHGLLVLRRGIRRAAAAV